MQTHASSRVHGGLKMLPAAVRGTRSIEEELGHPFHSRICQDEMLLQLAHRGVIFLRRTEQRCETEAESMHDRTEVREHARTEAHLQAHVCAQGVCVYSMNAQCSMSGGNRSKQYIYIYIHSMLLSSASGSSPGSTTAECHTFSRSGSL